MTILLLALLARWGAVLIRGRAQTTRLTSLSST